MGDGGFKQVTRQECIDFVKNYPVRLEQDVAGMFEPPLRTFNDFSDGKVWPESIVAKVVLNEDCHGMPGIPDKKNKYYILDKGEE